MPEISTSDLQVNQPIEAEASDSTLVISVDPDQPLPVGTHLFQLEVTDDSGNRSQPARFRVTIIDNSAPTAIIRGPERVPHGSEFTLDGSQSTDVGGGQIAKYIWTLIG